MAFNGSGTFILPTGNPVVSNTLITAATQNTTMTDVANGLSNCVTKDGQTTLTANLPMAGKKLTGLGAGTASGDSVRYDELQLKAPIDSPTFTGNVTLPSTTTAPGFITLGDGASAIQLQTQTGFVTGGTSTAYTLSTTTPLATFTASIDVSGNMTVTSVSTGTIVVGMRITGTGIVGGSYVTGGSGLSWTTNVTAVVASTTITGTVGLIPKERVRVNFNLSSGVAPTLSINGTTAKNLKQFNASGSKIPAIVYSGQLADVEYDGTDYVVLDSIQPLGQLAPLGVTQSAGQMIVTLNPTTIDFRNSSTDVTSANTVTTLSVTTAINLTIPATATLGTASALESKLLVLAINNGGTVELAVCNIWNNIYLNEATTINTSILNTSSTSATTNYSTAARTGVNFRVIGILTSTQTIAGTWASLPTIQSGGAWTPLVNQLTTVYKSETGTNLNVDFKNIPPWVKKITISYSNLYVSAGTNDIAIQIGSSGTAIVTNYAGSYTQFGTATSLISSPGTKGWPITNVTTPTSATGTIFTGKAEIILAHESPPSYVFTSSFSRIDSAAMGMSNGNIVNATVTKLDMIRITTNVATPTNQYINGDISLTYE